MIRPTNWCRPVLRFLIHSQKHTHTHTSFLHTPAVLLMVRDGRLLVTSLPPLGWDCTSPTKLWWSQWVRRRRRALGCGRTPHALFSSCIFSWYQGKWCRQHLDWTFPKNCSLETVLMIMIIIITTRFIWRAFRGTQRYCKVKTKTKR